MIPLCIKILHLLVCIISIHCCNVHRVLIDESSEYINIDGYDPASGPTVFVLNKHRQSSMAESLKRDVLLEQYGDTNLILSSSNSYSHQTMRLKLSAYILNIVDLDSKSSSRANETFYMFGHNDNSEPWKSIVSSHYNLPPCGPICINKGTTTIGIGGEQSGVGFHIHGAAFSEMIIGHKRWLIYPLHLQPDMSKIANMSMSEWYESIFPTLEHREEIWDCVIGPGELLYFPTNYYHATLNMDAYNVFVSLFV